MKKEELENMIRGIVSDETKGLRDSATDVSSILSQSQKGVEGGGEADPGLNAARVVRAITASNGDSTKAQKYAEKAFGKSRGGKDVIEFFEKANELQDFDSGGFMVPPAMSDEIIDLLRPRSVMRSAGTPVVPMPRGSLSLPKQTGDVSASYVGESEDITKSEPTGGQIILSAKKLSTIVPISNDLLQVSAGDKADQFVRNSIVRRMATREDRAFIRDNGSQNTPRGLLHWALDSNKMEQTGTSSADVEKDLLGQIQNLEGNDVDMTQPVWIMSPRSKNFLINLRDPNGNLIYPEIRGASPSLYTYPVYVTNNVPSNLGNSGNESEIYLVNISDTMIGETGGMEITSDDAASYMEGGSLVSAFSRDQTVIRAITRHDFAVSYQEAISVLSGVTYGI